MVAEKFKALVHFIIHACRDNPERLGAIRLNKALWFTDKLAYQGNGEPVTGEKYVKRRMGPVPATILRTLRELEKENKIEIHERESNYGATKYISCSEPDLLPLSSANRNLAKAVLNFVCGYTATEISEFTHDEAWDAALEGEEIPLFATLITGEGAITDETKEWAEKVVLGIEDEEAERINAG